MTISPPDHLLTVEEFSQLPDDGPRRFELQEGVPLVTPAAGAHQQRVAANLAGELRDQLPPNWDVINDSRVITDRGFAPSVWVPDLVIVAAAGNPRLITADQVLLAVEITVLGSKGTGTRVKPVEYAEAGIPFYWVIDLEETLSLVAYRLTGGGRYQVAPAAKRIFETSEPFSLKVDLAGLSEGREQ